eukprot:117685-Chlamydomonas_euryale.AAC.1
MFDKALGVTQHLQHVRQVRQPQPRRLGRRAATRQPLHRHERRRVLAHDVAVQKLQVGLHLVAQPAQHARGSLRQAAGCCGSGRCSSRPGGEYDRRAGQRCRPVRHLRLKHADARTVGDLRLV